MKEVKMLDGIFGNRPRRSSVTVRPKVPANSEPGSLTVQELVEATRISQGIPERSWVTTTPSGVEMCCGFVATESFKIPVPIEHFGPQRNHGTEKK